VVALSVNDEGFKFGGFYSLLLCVAREEEQAVYE
jgi:hypothetical protein